MIDAVKAKSKKSAVLRWVAFVAMNILSVYLVVFGVRRLLQGYIVTLSLLILFFIVPIIVIIASLCCIRSNTSIVGKYVLCMLLIVLLLINTFFFSIFGEFIQLKSYHGEAAVDKYTENYFEYMKLPKISELGDFLDFEYHDYKYQMIIGEPATHTLICRYDTEIYKIQKNKIDSTYYFQDDKINTTEPEVTIDGYNFRMLSDEVYFDYFPKKVAFIATNDSTNEIVYLRFFNVELDYIESLKEFILSDCGWKYIR